MGFEQLFEFRKYSLAQRNSRATATTSTRLNIYLTPASTVRSAMPHAEPVAAVPTDAALIAAWQGGDQVGRGLLVTALPGGDQRRIRRPRGGGLGVGHGAPAGRTGGGGDIQPRGGCGP